MTALVLGVVCTLGGKDPDASGGKPSASPTTAPTDVSKPAGRTDLDLRTPLASLENHRDDNGLRFRVFGDQNGTDLVIRDGVLKREPADAFGRTGAPSLVFESDRALLEVSASYRFTEGQTQTVNAVVGACRISFAQGSIEFAVRPTGWKLFYTVAEDARSAQDPDRDDQGRRLREATGRRREDRVHDHHARGPGDLQRDGPLPGGVRTFTDPHVAQLW